MTEAHIFILVIGGAALWRLGGWKWKGFRRYLWPALFVAVGLHVGIDRVILLCVAVFSSLFYHMGYGEKYDWWWRTGVGVGYATSTSFLGFTWWQVIVPVVFIGTFVLSNWKPTKQDFSWAICELSVGGCIGSMIATLYMKGG